jgi:hypothetical protein
MEGGGGSKKAHGMMTMMDRFARSWDRQQQKKRTKKRGFVVDDDSSSSSNNNNNSDPDDCSRGQDDEDEGEPERSRTALGEESGGVGRDALSGTSDRIVALQAPKSKSKTKKKKNKRRKTEGEEGQQMERESQESTMMQLNPTDVDDGGAPVRQEKEEEGLLDESRQQQQQGEEAGSNSYKKKKRRPKKRSRQKNIVRDRRPQSIDLHHRPQPTLGSRPLTAETRAKLEAREREACPQKHCRRRPLLPLDGVSDERGSGAGEETEKKRSARVEGSAAIAPDDRVRGASWGGGGDDGGSDGEGEGERELPRRMRVDSSPPPQRREAYAREEAGEGARAGQSTPAKLPSKAKKRKYKNLMH